MSAISLLLLILAVSESTAVSSSAIGINYGQVADNLPAPDAILPLLSSLGSSHVKLYDSNPKILHAFAGTGIEFVVGLPDDSVPIITSPTAALSWVNDNLHPFLPQTNISAVTVGNEVFASNNTLLINSLVPAMNSLHSTLSSLGLDYIKVTTAHALDILSTSYPPSAGAFRSDLMPYITPLLDFLYETNSPFLINAYPFFAYKTDPKSVSLDYILFESNPGFVDPVSGLKYDNMLHAQVDAVRAAIAAAGGRGIEVRVSETGWPSHGDNNEFGATAENAAKYNGNLMRMVAQGKGTPMSPDTEVRVYIFSLFDENLKPGPASERHYGLFNPDGNPVYDIGIVKSGVVSGNSTSTLASGNPYTITGGGASSSSLPIGDNASSSTSSSSSSSSSSSRRNRVLLGIAVAAAALVVALGLICHKRGLI